ncbi:RsmE family RNA methyltransferase [Lentisphaerota bacterium WC36G]|nr:16S rRNA (uracil(1498)-N(3))-methyltransferase [Lentisphaerae bacterium WC36]
MHCFYCEGLKLDSSIVSLNKIESQHLFKTLRARNGDKVELINGRGVFAHAEVAEGKQLKIINTFEQLQHSQKLMLFLSPPKKNKMDILLRQCAELGVNEIVLIITENSVSIPHKANMVEKWQQNLIEGCKQSKNAFLPQISLPIKFKELFENSDDFDFSNNIDAYFGAIHGQKSVSIVNNLKNYAVGWFVGPEGGFTSDEELVLEQNNIKPLRIGNYVMRVETAVVAGCALLININS